MLWSSLLESETSLSLSCCHIEPDTMSSQEAHPVVASNELSLPIRLTEEELLRSKKQIARLSLKIILAFNRSFAT